MYKGGPNYTPQSAIILKYTGLLLPVILVFYGLLIKAGAIDAVPAFHDSCFLMLSFWFIYLGVIQFLVPSKNKLDSLLRIVAYHLLAAAYLLFISGISSPLVILWIVLLIASNTYFSRDGLNASILWFTIVSLIDVYWWHNINTSIIIYDMAALVAVVLTGVVLMSSSKAHEIERTALTKSKAKENLQRDQLSTIVNNISDAIISTDKNGIIRVYNSASLNLLDTNDSLNGKFIDDVVNLTDKNKSAVSLFKQLQDARSSKTRDDLSHAYDANESIRIEVIFSPIRNTFSHSNRSETSDGYVIIMRDITKSKSLEEERDEFVSVVSHELRTPITIVEGTISNAQVMMKHPDSTAAMLGDAVDLAHDQIVYLAHMVNDLSTLSRAERGVSDAAEDIDVREMIHKLHEEYHKEAADKGLHLNLDLGISLGHVNTSRLYLEEMLQNLITNAIKYTKKGSITVSVKQKLDIIKFSVKDTGIGISKSDQTKIFAKFFRSEDYRTRETSGTGLGLYVAAKLAHKTNTKINLESRLNHGSTFSFSLPAVKK
jgi:PAS domain S-box-containing protein